MTEDITRRRLLTHKVHPLTKRIQIMKLGSTNQSYVIFRSSQEQLLYNNNNIIIRKICI